MKRTIASRARASRIRKSFARFVLGTMKLPPGRTILSLRATEFRQERHGLAHDPDDVSEIAFYASSQKTFPKRGLILCQTGVVYLCL